MPKPTWRIVSRIFEGADTHPVVEHIFYGQTPQQAARIYEAHMRSDAFLSGCVLKQEFGTTMCREEHVLQIRTLSNTWVDQKRLS